MFKPLGGNRLRVPKFFLKIFGHLGLVVMYFIGLEHLEICENAICRERQERLGLILEQTLT